MCWLFTMVVKCHWNWKSSILALSSVSTACWWKIPNYSRQCRPYPTNYPSLRCWLKEPKKRGEKGHNVVIKRGETMTKGALRGQVGQKMGRKGEEMMTKGSECGTCLDSFKTPFIPRFIVKLLTAEAICVPKWALMLLILILVAAVLVGGHLKSRSCQTD